MLVHDVFEEVVKGIEAVSKEKIEFVKDLLDKADRHPEVCEEIEALSKVATTGDWDATVKRDMLVCELDAQKIQFNLLMLVEAMESGVASYVKSYAKVVLEDYNRCLGSLENLHYASHGYYCEKVPLEAKVRKMYALLDSLPDDVVVSAADRWAETLTDSLNWFECSARDGIPNPKANEWYALRTKGRVTDVNPGCS